MRFFAEQARQIGNMFHRNPVAMSKLMVLFLLTKAEACFILYCAYEKCRDGSCIRAASLIAPNFVSVPENLTEWCTNLHPVSGDGLTIHVTDTDSMTTGDNCNLRITITMGSP